MRCTLAVSWPSYPGRMSALSTSPTRGETSATTSTARLTTAITSSHSPSMLVNIAFVSLGSPDSRTTRTAAATASVTDAGLVAGHGRDAERHDHGATLSTRRSVSSCASRSEFLRCEV